MARIVLAASGYWGDVAPFVPVARGLAGRGHHVDLITPAGVQDRLRGEPVQLHAAGRQFSPEQLFAEHGRTIQRLGAVGGSMVIPWMLKRTLLDPLEEVYARVEPVVARADAVLVHPQAVPVRLAAERSGLPWATLHLFPMYVPSDEEAPSTLSFSGLPRPIELALNRAAWQVYRWGTALVAGDRRVNGFRRRLGLEPVRANLTVGSISPHLTVLPVPEGYWTRPPDWPASTAMPGFISWEDPGSGLAPEVRAYLDSGPDPVLVTLGTSAATHARELFSRIAAAVDEMDVRGLFLVGSEDNIKERLRGRPGVWPFAPLAEVLPRCRAVVHSGAHGTNATVLQAGLPALVLPELMDQQWHADRVRSLGAGLSLGRSQRGTARITAALRTLVGDEVLSRRAKELAADFASQDGVSGTCDRIEQLLAT